MRKNKAMRAASVLLVMTLLTTSMISGTFAKYTSQDSANDSALVAKWGVIIATGGSLYGEAYGSDSTAVDYSSSDTSQTVRVSAQGTDIVAPGTKSNGQGLKFTVSGNPESATKIDSTITYQNIYLAEGDWGVMVQDTTVTAENFVPGDTDLYTKSGTTYTKTVSGNFSPGTSYYRLQNAVTASGNYYPVVYTGASVSGKTTADDSLKAVCEDMASSLNGSAVSFNEVKTTGKWTGEVKAKEYAANTDLSDTFKNLNQAALSWQWDFESSNKAVTDPEDTILGNLINGISLDKAYVVYRASSTASYSDTNTNENGLVKVGDTEVGGTVTSFSISVTATQID